jgi:predicted amidohydrolase YtcJ
LRRRDFFLGTSGAAFLAGCAGSKPQLGSKPSADADVDAIFIASHVHTLGQNDGAVRALGVRAKKIVALGSVDEMMSLRGSKTRVVDLGKRTLLPGFVDPHVHSAFASLRDWEDVGPFTTPDLKEARSRLRQAAESRPEGEWIQAKMLDPSLQSGVPLSRAELDKVSSVHPIFVVESNGHIAYANSLAFKQAGVDEQTKDPPQGRFIRDEARRLTGRVEENPAFAPFIAVMPQPTQEELVELLTADFTDAVKRGCTTVNDMGVGSVLGAADLALLELAVMQGLPLRCGAFLVTTLFDEWEAKGFRPGRRDSGVYLTGIKGWADGSNQARTGFMREPYLGMETRGALNYTPQEIERVIQRAVSSGWPVSIHANGDAAIDVVLDAYERVGASLRDKDIRPRIEHCSILHQDQIERMASLGVSPSFLIGHVHFWGRAFRDEILGATRSEHLDPCASALRGGLRISLHSDFNVTPIDPLRCISNAVLRDMRDGGETLAPSERITAEQGLRAMTIDAAWQCHLDHICGSLEVGKSADCVVLDEDPLQVSPKDIADIPIHSTWFEGEASFTT